MHSLRKTEGKIHLYHANKEEEDGVRTVIEYTKTLLNNEFDKEDILVLTRTRKSDAYKLYFQELRKLGVRIITMHQAKGLEAKVVFIIGLTGDYHGFPNVRDTDRIFQIIKPSNFELLMEEERRLFYVALTRAKQKLFLISEVGNESEFISEIPDELLHRINSMNGKLDKSFISTDSEEKNSEKTFSKTHTLSYKLQNTLDLCKNGLEINEIANQMNLTVKTIEKHIEKLMLFGEKIEISRFVDPETEKRIMDAITILGDKRLKPIKEHLGEDITYGEIRIIRGKINFGSKKHKIVNVNKTAKNYLKTNESKNFDYDLFDVLKGLRKKLAHENRILPYLIFHDSSLKDMVTYLPQNLSDFRMIKGVGRVNLEKWGDVFLNEIINHSNKNEISPIHIKAPSNPDNNKYSLNDIRKKYPQAYEPWELEDDDKLIAEVQKGKNIQELMKLFGRNEGGIKSRLHKFGLQASITGNTQPQSEVL